MKSAMTFSRQFWWGWITSFSGHIMFGLALRFVSGPYIDYFTVAVEVRAWHLDLRLWNFGTWQISQLFKFSINHVPSSTDLGRTQSPSAWFAHGKPFNGLQLYDPEAIRRDHRPGVNCSNCRISPILCQRCLVILVGFNMFQHVSLLFAWSPVTLLTDSSSLVLQGLGRSSWGPLRVRLAAASAFAVKP